MIDAKNNWSGIVGVVADPEVVNDNIINFRVAVDGAGRDKDEKDNYSGYFTMKYFMNDGDPNAKFVKSQIDAGNIKKGTTLGVVGKLMHERWSKDGQKSSMVTIWAANLTYVGRRSDPSETSASTDEAGSTGETKQATASIPSTF